MEDHTSVAGRMEVGHTSHLAQATRGRRLDVEAGVSAWQEPAVEVERLEESVEERTR